MGDEESAGYEVVCERVQVDPETGANHFLREENGLHAYVIKKKENGYYEAAIHEKIK